MLDSHLLIKVILYAIYYKVYCQIICCPLVLTNRGMKLTVVLGAHDLKKDRSAFTRVEVKLYHIHPMYDSKKLFNDIMLLQVNIQTHYVFKYDENKRQKYLWRV